MALKDDLNKEEALLKNTILSTNTTFKAAFGATMGFYAAQFLATLLGLAVFGGVFVAIYLVYHFLK